MVAPWTKSNSSYVDLESSHGRYVHAYIFPECSDVALDPIYFNIYLLSVNTYFTCQSNINF